LLWIAPLRDTLLLLFGGTERGCEAGAWMVFAEGYSFAFLPPAAITQASYLKNYFILLPVLAETYI